MFSNFFSCFRALPDVNGLVPSFTLNSANVDLKYTTDQPVPTVYVTLSFNSSTGDLQLFCQSASTNIVNPSELKVYALTKFNTTNQQSLFEIFSAEILSSTISDNASALVPSIPPAQSLASFRSYDLAQVNGVFQPSTEYVYATYRFGVRQTSTPTNLAYYTVKVNFKLEPV